jgi:hypothetical protein
LIVLNLHLQVNLAYFGPSHIHKSPFNTAEIKQTVAYPITTQSPITLNFRFRRFLSAICCVFELKLHAVFVGLLQKCKLKEIFCENFFLFLLDGFVGKKFGNSIG